MKPINEMNLAELMELYDRYWGADDISYRIRELHELTRWIPVEERFPTTEDAKGAECIVWSNDGRYWRRIDNPEGV